MQGFLNINKPGGISSFDVIRSIKKINKSKSKIGHLGTLDPLATGVLPIALGQATKLIPWLSDLTKEYIATMVLGYKSDTQDKLGEIVSTGNCNYEIETLREVLIALTGDIMQTPPMYSAVHHEGKRLYELARNGEYVERKPRPIKVYEIELLQCSIEDSLETITIRVKCSPGTYVRTICHDIGEKLGTGAYLASLTRTRSGSFYIDGSISLENLVAGKIPISDIIMPLEAVMGDYEAINVEEDEVKTVLNGNYLFRDKAQHAQLNDSQVVTIKANQKIIAIAKVAISSANIVLKPIRVLDRLESLTR